MSIKTITHARSVRTSLLAGCALLAAGAAHAQSVVLANSGYWSAAQLSAPPGGFPSCSVDTISPADGRMLGISVNTGDQTLRLSFDKQSWQIPSSAYITATVQIDGYPAWSQPVGTGAVSYDSHGMSMSVQPAVSREFVHEITSGSTITVRFTGNEPPWTFSLWGTTAVWGPFMQCAQNIAPQFVAALTPTQPFVAPQPYAAAPQPYVPAAPQPYVSAAPQPYVPVPTPQPQPPMQPTSPGSTV